MLQNRKRLRDHLKELEAAGRRQRKKLDPSQEEREELDRCSKLVADLRENKPSVLVGVLMMLPGTSS